MAGTSSKPAPFEALPIMGSKAWIHNRTPFSKWPKWYWALLICRGLILVPIRTILSLINICILAAGIGWLGTLGMSKADKTRPLSMWRRIVLKPMRALLNLQCWLWGWTSINHVGAPAPREEAPIIVSNHLGFVEPTVLMAAVRVAPLSAAENQTLFVRQILDGASPAHAVTCATGDALLQLQWR